MAGNDIRLIVGLGNPGSEYARTRHNAGIWLADELARRHGGTFRHEGKHQAELARVRINGSEICLAKPLTVMNRRGGPASSVLASCTMLSTQQPVAPAANDMPNAT